MVKPPFASGRTQTPRPLEWVGSRKADLKRFPAAVQDRMGFALYQAQIGAKHHDAKPLRGLGAGVLEVVSRWDGNAHRAAYLVRFQEEVYVLHAFQKKSTRGTATPGPEIELVKRRLRVAEEHYRATLARRD